MDPTEPDYLARDRVLDADTTGPRWLSDPQIAQIVVEALFHGEAVRGMYQLHAFVIMPNHVHVVWLPLEKLSGVLDWLKGATSRRANALLGRRGVPFWQDESYDHWIRTGKELNSIVGYVEHNPVTAGLVKTAEEWPWSSARYELKFRQPARLAAPRCGSGSV